MIVTCVGLLAFLLAEPTDLLAPRPDGPNGAQIILDFVQNTSELVLFGIAVVLLLPCLVYSGQCLLAVAGRRRSRARDAGRAVDFAVVVPAHNEEQCIGATVRHLSGQLNDGERLIVVADNCTDRTAKEAREAGAEVWSRKEPDRRGKGYAISHALERLAENPPSVVVLIDADCRISDGGLSHLAQAAAMHRRPVQARYLMTVPADSGPVASVSALAFLIRNLVRPLAMKRLRMPCHLTGSGMAFPWRQICAAPKQRGNIVEDLAIGLELSIAGFPPMFVPDVLVESEPPATRSATGTQRRRWEGGQLVTALQFAPRLLREAWRQRRPGLAGLAADLAVPPLALLVLVTCMSGGVAGTASLAGATPIPFLMLLSNLLLVAIATLLAWARFGRHVVPLGVLMSAPLYLAWKIPLYVSILFRQRGPEWIRTARSVEESSALDQPISHK